MTVTLADYPWKADCGTAGCGHSSDEHRLHNDGHGPCDRNARYPCHEPGCACPDFLRSPQNLADLETALLARELPDELAAILERTGVAW